MAFQQNWKNCPSRQGGELIAMDLSSLFYPAQCWAFGSVGGKLVVFVAPSSAPQQHHWMN